MPFINIASKMMIILTGRFVEKIKHLNDFSFYFKCYSSKKKVIYRRLELFILIFVDRVFIPQNRKNYELEI